MNSRLSPTPTIRDQLELEVELHLSLDRGLDMVAQHPSWLLTLMSNRDSFYLQVNFKIGTSPIKPLTPTSVHHPILPEQSRIVSVDASFFVK